MHDASITLFNALVSRRASHHPRALSWNLPEAIAKLEWQRQDLNSQLKQLCTDYQYLKKVNKLKYLIRGKRTCGSLTRTRISYKVFTIRI